VAAWAREESLRQRVVEWVQQTGVPCYLVGGTVRDLLLGRASMDIDLAVAGRATALARWLADKLPGAFVPLDPTRDVARVVVGRGAEQRHVDLAALRAADITGDLWRRDYTINAMAVAIDATPGWALLDPTGGAADLAAGRLKMVYSAAFVDDPLRVLRGVRLAADLALTWQGATRDAAHLSAPDLAEVSCERVRDELLHILELAHSGPALQMAQELGALAQVLPELADGIAALGQLEALEAGSETLRAWFGPLAERLRADWHTPLAGRRERWPWLKLVALLNLVFQTAEPVLAIGRRLSLSNRECAWLGRTVEARHAAWLVDDATSLDRLTRHRFLRRYGVAGLDGAVLAAVAQAAVAQAASSRDASVVAGKVTTLLDAWYAHHAQIVAPPLLLDGTDMITLLHVAPGPLIGRLLDALCEDQVMGLASTRDEALERTAQRLRDEQSS
jgi:poly(A) polymerase/tRNA nucleotidyltransferase (CCA-adding enzyme)